MDTRQYLRYNHHSYFIHYIPSYQGTWYIMYAYRCTCTMLKYFLRMASRFPFGTVALRTLNYSNCSWKFWKWNWNWMFDILHHRARLPLMLDVPLCHRYHQEKNFFSEASNLPSSSLKICFDCSTVVEPLACFLNSWSKMLLSLDVFMKKSEMEDRSVAASSPEREDSKCLVVSEAWRKSWIKMSSASSSRSAAMVVDFFRGATFLSESALFRLGGILALPPAALLCFCLVPSQVFGATIQYRNNKPSIFLYQQVQKPGKVPGNLTEFQEVE